MSSKAICPKCRAEIPLEDINVSKDIALCRQCGQTSSYADLVQDTPEDFDLANAPKGAWYRQTPPRAFEVGASTRSPIAFFLVPFMCIWSGGSLGGIYGTQIIKGHFSLYQSLFGIPFLLGTLLFGSAAIMAVCGKVVVTVDGDHGVIFTGVGPLGWRRRFNWRDVKRIHRSERSGSRTSNFTQITFDGPKQFNFGAGLNQVRIAFMNAALRKKWNETGH